MKKVKPPQYKYRKPDGRYERPDPRPMAIPIGMERPESLQEKMRRLIRDEAVNMQLAQGGVETFEEADNFNIPDDPIDPSTPYEEDFDPHGMIAREQEVRAGFVDEPKMDRVEKARVIGDKIRAVVKKKKMKELDYVAIAEAIVAEVEESKKREAEESK